MDKAEILVELKKIMEKVFDADDLTVTPSTVAADIEEWDSLNHIQLVVAIEKHFKIKFSASEIQKWRNVGETIDSIYDKLPK